MIIFWILYCTAMQRIVESGHGNEHHNKRKGDDVIQIILWGYGWNSQDGLGIRYTRCQ